MSHITGAGGAVVERLDGAGRVYLPRRETAGVDAALRPGDLLIFSMRPGGEGYDAVLG